jgi:uncharacterized protein
MLAFGVSNVVTKDCEVMVIMAQPTQERVPIAPSMVLGVCVLLGLAVAGHLIGRGAIRFKSDVRTVTVKGLVERDVKADEAVWTLRLTRASDDLQDAHARISADLDATQAFLVKQGFADAEITREPTRTIDKLAREYGQSTGAERLRYIVTTALVVKTQRVDLIATSQGSTVELLKSGVVLGGERSGGGANPRYLLSRFNELRPQLLADATRNARMIAEQFAAESGARVGAIRSANQGVIQIFGSNGDDESGPYTATSTLQKKIRVVSTFEFELR